MRLARFSLHFARNRMTPCDGNHYNLFHSLLPKWSSHFPQLSLSLSLRGWYFRKKTSTCHSTLLRIALRVSTCISHVQLAESMFGRSVINNDLSHLGGYIYSIGLVKAVSESLQELVRTSCLSMLVNLNNV